MQSWNPAGSKPIFSHVYTALQIHASLSNNLTQEEQLERVDVLLVDLTVHGAWDHVSLPAAIAARATPPAHRRPTGLRSYFVGAV